MYLNKPLPHIKACTGHGIYGAWRRRKKIKAWEHACLRTITIVLQKGLASYFFITLMNLQNFTKVFLLICQTCNYYRQLDQTQGLDHHLIKVIIPYFCCKIKNRNIENNPQKGTSEKIFFKCIHRNIATYIITKNWVQNKTRKILKHLSEWIAMCALHKTKICLWIRFVVFWSNQWLLMYYSELSWLHC